MTTVMAALASQITHHNTCWKLWKKLNCFNKGKYCIDLGVRNDMCQMANAVSMCGCVGGKFRIECEEKKYAYFCIACFQALKLKQVHMTFELVSLCFEVEYMCMLAICQIYYFTHNAITYFLLTKRTYFLLVPLILAQARYNSKFFVEIVITWY